MLFAGGMVKASTEDLFAHETRRNPGRLQMRKNPPEVLFQHRNRADFLGKQRAKKTTPGREDGAVREDRKRKDSVRRDAFSVQKKDGTPSAWVTKAGYKHRGFW